MAVALYTAFAVAELVSNVIAVVVPATFEPLASNAACTLLVVQRLARDVALVAANAKVARLVKPAKLLVRGIFD